MIVCISSWHTDVSSTAQPDKSCTPTNTQLTVSSFASCVNSPTHQCVCHNTHTTLTLAEPDSLELICDGPAAGPESQDCAWLLSLQLAGSALFAIPWPLLLKKSMISSPNAKRAERAAVNKTDTWDATLSRDLLTAFRTINDHIAPLHIPTPLFDLLI